MTGTNTVHARTAYGALASTLAAVAPPRDARTAVPALRVLITGAGGQLGRELMQRRPDGVDVIALTHDELDISSRRGVEDTCRALAPDVIINAAGCNDIDDPDLAYAVNADGVANLARVASGESRLIHVSSGAVFSGQPASAHKPEDAPRPVDALAASKAEGEALATGIAHQRSLVVRTDWLYSPLGDNCFTQVLQALRSRQPITMPDNRFLTPTWVAGLAHALWLMAFRPTLYGIHHWTDRGGASWYAFARAVHEQARGAGLLGADCPAELIQGVRYPDDQEQCALLDNSFTWKSLGTRSEHWRRALGAMITEMAEVKYAHA